jgi:signal transduction histidine kinase
MSHQDPRLGQIFENIAERTQHLFSFIEGYREVARLPLPDQRETSWVDFLTGLESQKRFRIVGEIPARRGYFDPSQLERVLINLLNNAIEADSDPEEVVVEVVDEENGFCVKVMDRGTGMPEPVLKQAMLPFFSTKRTGTGVGLALAREIIEAHGGQLTLANRDGGGLVVSCFLPDPTVPAPRTSIPRIPAAATKADETST